MQSKVLIYVVLIIGVGLAINHFTKSENMDETIVEQSEITEEKAWKRAEFTMLNIPPKRIPKKILVEDGKKLYPITVSDIILCEKKDNVVELKTLGGEVNSTMTLTALKNKIKDSYFIYGGLQSYIINFDFVTEYRPERSEFNKNTYSYKIIMSNGDEITLPKGQRIKFLRQFKNYVEKYE